MKHCVIKFSSDEVDILDNALCKESERWDSVIRNLEDEEVSDYANDGPFLCRLIDVTAEYKRSTHQETALELNLMFKEMCVLLDALKHYGEYLQGAGKDKKAVEDLMNKIVIRYHKF